MLRELLSHWPQIHLTLQLTSFPGARALDEYVAKEARGADLPTIIYLISNKGEWHDMSATQASGIITRAFQRNARFFFRSATVCKSSTRMRDDLSLISTWCNGGRRKVYAINTNTVHNTLKTDTKYSHSVRSTPTLKDEERFRNRLVRKTYKRSLYERTFMSEPSFHRETCYINWAI